MKLIPNSVFAGIPWAPVQAVGCTIDTGQDGKREIPVRRIGARKMRLNLRLNTRLTLALICVLGAGAEAQDRHDWQSLARLQAGDRIHLSLKSGPVEGAFQNWTPEQVTAGTVTARKEDVLKIERYRQGGRGRGKTAAIGALVGFGGGFAIGAAAFGCHQGGFGPCISRGAGGALVGGVGAVIGAGVGALLPRHTRELIYSAR